jgi:hypothetical protein
MRIYICMTSICLLLWQNSVNTLHHPNSLTQSCDLYFQEQWHEKHHEESVEEIDFSFWENVILDLHRYNRKYKVVGIYLDEHFMEYSLYGKRWHNLWRMQ